MGTTDVDFYNSRDVKKNVLLLKSSGCPDDKLLQESGKTFTGRLQILENFEHPLLQNVKAIKTDFCELK